MTPLILFLGAVGCLEATEVIPARVKKKLKSEKKIQDAPVVWSFMVTFLFERDYL